MVQKTAAVSSRYYPKWILLSPTRTFCTDIQDPFSSPRIRNLDMIQALGWNSLERTGKDWHDLFARADPRFEFLGTRTPEGSSISMIEAVYKPFET